MQWNPGAFVYDLQTRIPLRYIRATLLVGCPPYELFALAHRLAQTDNVPAMLLGMGAQHGIGVGGDGGFYLAQQRQVV